MNKIILNENESVLEIKRIVKLKKDIQCSHQDNCKNETNEEKEKSNKKNSDNKISKKAASLEDKIIKLSSGQDLILSKNGRSPFDIIIMPSKNIYAIKTNDELINISDINASVFRDYFLKMMNNRLELTVNNNIFSKINKHNIVSIPIFLDKYKDILNTGLISFDFYLNYSGTNSKYFNNIINIIKDKNNHKDECNLLEKICKTTSFLKSKDDMKYNKDFYLLSMDLLKKYDYNMAIYFVYQYTKSSMTNIIYTENTKLFNDLYNLNAKTLIDYICFGLYGQGYSNIDIPEYCSYLTTAYLNNPNNFDKYPKHLLSDSYIERRRLRERNDLEELINMNFSSFNYNDLPEEIKEIKKNEFFKEKYNEMKSLFKSKEDIVYKNNNFSIVLPQKIKDLTDEGRFLGHCVGTYVKKIIDGECFILFVRKNDDLNTPYLTVELKDTSYKSYYIYQIQGINKRTNLTDEEIEFFKEISSKFNIGFKNSNFTE
jgi:hypothetical protein